MLGAKVKGFALAPPTEPSMFDVLGCAGVFESVEGDIRDRDSVRKELVNFAPDVVFHLAAQALVIDSYAHAFETFQTNALGTASVLEACRDSDSVRGIVAVATDKVYENREWKYSYRESDPLGGKDPYSASKAAAELVVASYRQSFFQPRGVALASGRAGNVFGGGDWADNRLVPDGFRAFSTSQPLIVRNPSAIRPWQFVLEPLLGYLMLGRACLESTEYDTAFNFGPNEEDVLSVAQLADAMTRAWGKGASWRAAEGPSQANSASTKGANSSSQANSSPAKGANSSSPEASKNSSPKFEEANTLILNSGYAKQRLKWSPLLSIEEALGLTMSWYKVFAEGDMKALKRTSEEQLGSFSSQCESALAQS